MPVLRIDGSPIGGEDSREAAWRAAVADAARPMGLHNVRKLSLCFTLESGRRVDVDNLARPALNGLRDAGWFGHGFKSLDALAVTKKHDGVPGLDVVDDLVAGDDDDDDAEFVLASRSQIPTDGKPEIRRVDRGGAGGVGATADGGRRRR